MSRPPEITFTDDQEASAALFQRAFDWVYGQLRAAQAQQPDVARALADLQANGLTRLAETLGPVFERTVALDEHLQVLEAQYLGDGVVPAILAQAAASVDGKLFALGNQQDAQLAAYAGLAAAMFAAKTHAHAISDVAGLADALASRRPAILDRFTTSGTWQKRDGLVAAWAITIGGGGGGGAGCSTANLQYPYGGTGGGGGGFSATIIAADALAATENVQVGAGGLGGVATAADGNPGLTGGASTFGALLRATGGEAGLGGIGSGGGALAGGTGGRGLYSGGTGSGVAAGASQLNTAASLPTGFAAGGGGCGAFGSYGATPGPTAGSICFSHAGLATSLAAGVAGGTRYAGGGGGGGGVRQRGFDGGGPGGGGGGGGTGSNGNGNGAGTGGPAGAGGTGANGAVFILNIF